MECGKSSEMHFLSRAMSDRLSMFSTSSHLPTQAKRWKRKILLFLNIFYSASSKNKRRVFISSRSKFSSQFDETSESIQLQRKIVKILESFISDHLAQVEKPLTNIAQYKSDKV